jgi:hypothetical protein
MHPVWSRKFEPPAVSGGESQGVLETLMLLYRRTGDRKYLAPVPKALDYLRRSRLPDGRLARFYELKTNRPLFFTRDYRLTYDGSDAPRHYGFVVESRLDAIEAELRRLRDAAPGDRNRDKPARPAAGAALAARVRSIIDGMDSRGAWLEPGRLKIQENAAPGSRVIRSSTFVENVRTLCRFISSHP